MLIRGLNKRQIVNCACIASLTCNILFFMSYSTHNKGHIVVSYEQQAIANLTDILPKSTADEIPAENPHEKTRKPKYQLPLCPHRPPHLEGDLQAMLEHKTPEELISMLPENDDHGRIQPTFCKARQTLAIIIPYRNRYPHLHVLIHNLFPILMRQQADATFYVIEQAPPTTFNRGALLNVGFLEAEKIAQYDCYVFHDVDLVPLNDKHMYRCGDNPRHLAVAMNKNKFHMPYRGYFGGAVAFTRQQYLDINGNSNLYFGWGGEDDDLRDRVENKGYTIEREAVEIAKYVMLSHKRDPGNEINPERRVMMKSGKQRQDIEGLSSISYKVNSIDFGKLYTWINVDLNSAEISKTIPDFTLNDLKNLKKKPNVPATNVTEKPPQPPKAEKKLESKEKTEKLNPKFTPTKKEPLPEPSKSHAPESVPAKKEPVAEPTKGNAPESIQASVKKEPVAESPKGHAPESIQTSVKKESEAEPPKSHAADSLQASVKKEPVPESS